jgi:hypothetical protein
MSVPQTCLRTRKHGTRLSLRCGKVRGSYGTDSQCSTSEHAIEKHTGELKAFLDRMGRDTRQGAVGLVIDRDYLEIGFPLQEVSAPKRPRGTKRR